MANIEELTFDGYVFANAQDLELAKSEAKKIAYIEAHADMSNIGVVKGVYEKAIEERYFQTPIGLEYLRDMQKAYSDSKNGAEELRPIPLYTTFKRIDFSEKSKAQTRMTKAQKKELSLRMKYRNAVLIAGIFFFLCVAMLAITMRGSTINALNYKTAVTNQYSEWEQELREREIKVKERENAVRDKEIELGIEN
ncbi:MAG: hypothetical protein IK121_00235 [Lachnospiraceae bacterium]|nr:hypothetical protein [Lachnospiraceae bacterium]MBR5355329.1 hypothetical protein [Lachnospiraceae bacterium]